MNVSRCLVLLLLLVCVPACTQAITLQINVTDELDGTTVSGASVFVDNEFIGETNNEGTLSYSHAATIPLNMKVTMAGYENWLDVIGVDETEVIVALTKKNEPLTIEVYDADTFQPLADALVKVSGDSVSFSGRTDISGVSVFEIPARATYEVEISTPHYSPISRTITMPTAQKTVQYLLTRSDTFAILVKDSISLEPIAGAKVYIDGVYSGSTGQNGLHPVFLQREQIYRLLVEKTDYRSYDSEKFVSSEEAVLSVLLSKATYPVSIAVFDETITPVSNAVIYLNGSWQGLTDQYGRYSLVQLEAGGYSVNIQVDGYLDWSEEIIITGQGEDIVATLEYESADVTVEVREPDQRPVGGATVLIDSKQVGATSPEGVLTVALKTSTAYNITAYKDGYVPQSVEAKIPFRAASSHVTLTLDKRLDLAILLWAFGGALAIAVGLKGISRLGRRRRGRSRKGDSL